VISFLLIVLSAVSPQLHHYVFFNRDRDRIHEASFLDTHAFIGAQLKYSWRELEPHEGVYNFDEIERDLDFLNQHGKKLWIQLQDVSFDTTIVNVPGYLLADTTYHGGVSKQYEFQDDGTAVLDGLVARRWDPAVQARMHKLYAALGERFDGRIAGINTPETAVGFASRGPLRPTGYSPARYRDAVIENMRALKASFPESAVMVYANFMPGEGLPEHDKGYLRSVCEAAWKLGVEVGGPDLMPTKRGHRNHTLRFIGESRGKVPTGVAVQWGNYKQVDPKTGERMSVEALMAFACDSLGVDTIFWSTQEPYYSKELIPLLSGSGARPVRDRP